MKHKIYIFGYSTLLGTLSPVVASGNTKIERDADVLHQLNSMLDHDGIERRPSIHCIAPVLKIKNWKPKNIPSQSK